MSKFKDWRVTHVITSDFNDFDDNPIISARVEQDVVLGSGLRVLGSNRAFRSTNSRVSKRSAFITVPFECKDSIELATKAVTELEAREEGPLCVYRVLANNVLQVLPDNHLDRFSQALEDEDEEAVVTQLAKYKEKYALVIGDEIIERTYRNCHIDFGTGVDDLDYRDAESQERTSAKVEEEVKEEIVTA